MSILEKYKFDPKKEIDKIVSNVPKDPTRSRDPRTRSLRLSEFLNLDLKGEK